MIWLTLVGVCLAVLGAVIHSTMVGLVAIIMAAIPAVPAARRLARQRHTADPRRIAELEHDLGFAEPGDHPGSCTTCAVAGAR